MMKTLIAMAALAAVSAVDAATFTYTWVADPLPPFRPGIKRVLASGSFVVKSEAVNAGTINPEDVLVLDFKMTSPANYFYRSFDGGSLSVNPTTGEMLSGSLHATDPGSTYGHGAAFSAKAVAEDNPLGGSWHGHWQIIYSP